MTERTPPDPERRPMPPAKAQACAAFVRALRRSGNVAEAARAAGSNPVMLWHRRRNHPDFAARWDAALAFARARLARAGAAPPDAKAIRTAGGEYCVRANKHGHLRVSRAPAGRLTAAGARCKSGGGIAVMRAAPRERPTGDVYVRSRRAKAGRRFVSRVLPVAARLRSRSARYSLINWRLEAGLSWRGCGRLAGVARVVRRLCRSDSGRGTIAQRWRRGSDDAHGARSNHREQFGSKLAPRAGAALGVTKPSSCRRQTVAQSQRARNEPAPNAV